MCGPLPRSSRWPSPPLCRSSPLSPSCTARCTPTPTSPSGWQSTSWPARFLPCWPAPTQRWGTHTHKHTHRHVPFARPLCPSHPTSRIHGKVLALSACNVGGLGAFSAPWRPGSKATLSAFGLISNVFEDIPQLVIQVVLSPVLFLATFSFPSPAPTPRWLTLGALSRSRSSCARARPSPAPSPSPSHP